MDLHTVDTGFLAQRSGLAVGVDDLVDLLAGEAPVLDIGIPYIGQPVGGSDHAGSQHLLRHLVHAGEDHLGAAEAGAQLEEKLAAVGVDLLHKLFQRPQEQVLALIEPAAPPAHRGDAGDHEAYVGLGTRQEIRPGLFHEFAVEAHGAGAAHGAHDDAVFDGGTADLQRREQRFITHYSMFTFLSSLSLLPACRRSSSGSR